MIERHLAGCPVHRSVCECGGRVGLYDIVDEVIAALKWAGQRTLPDNRSYRACCGTHHRRAHAPECKVGKALTRAQEIEG